MKCKNKIVIVDGFIQTKYEDKLIKSSLVCLITNDEKGKTLSINNGAMQFTIPFEPIEKYLK